MEAIASLPGMHSFLSFHRYIVVPLQFRSSTTHPLTLHRHSLHIRRSLNTVCATGSLMKVWDRGLSLHDLTFRQSSAATPPNVDVIHHLSLLKRSWPSLFRSGRPVQLDLNLQHIHRKSLCNLHYRRRMFSYNLWPTPPAQSRSSRSATSQSDPSAPITQIHSWLLVMAAQIRRHCSWSAANCDCLKFVTAWCHSTHKPIRDNSPSPTICPPSLIAISFPSVVGLPTPPLVDSTVFQICLFIANLIVSIHCRFSRLPLHDSPF